MKAIRYLKVPTEKYLRKSIRAYFEGEPGCDLRKLKYEDGSISVPSAPGLGVRLDREKLAEYSEMYRRLGPYPYDRDPLRPRWTATIPNDRWANPADDRKPKIPY